MPSITAVLIVVLVALPVILIIVAYSRLWEKCPACKRRGQFVSMHPDNYTTIIIGRMCGACGHKIYETPRSAYED